MQLTDKVLLPATISYTDSRQQSSSPCADGAGQTTDANQTAEAGCSDVTVPAADDDDSGVDEMESTNVGSTMLATEDSTVGCVEDYRPGSATDQAGLDAADTAGGMSVMTVSLVNFPSYVSDTVDMDSASLLQPMSTAVHIDGTLLHSVDANIVITEPTAASDGQSATRSGEPESTMLAVTEPDDSSEIQRSTEWTRYYLSFFTLHLTQHILIILHHFSIMSVYFSFPYSF